MGTLDGDLVTSLQRSRLEAASNQRRGCAAFEAPRLDPPGWIRDVDDELRMWVDEADFRDDAGDDNRFGRVERRGKRMVRDGRPNREHEERSCRGDERRRELHRVITSSAASPQLHPSFGRRSVTSRTRWSSALRAGLPVMMMWSPAFSVSLEIFPCSCVVEPHSCLLY